MILRIGYSSYGRSKISTSTPWLKLTLKSKTKHKLNFSSSQKSEILLKNKNLSPMLALTLHTSIQSLAYLMATSECGDFPSS